MWIRCPNCGWSTRAAFDVARGVTCVSCGRYSSLERAMKLGATPQERFKKAFRFARAHRVDLSSAYSILLGIIPVSKALPIPQTYDYDPSFKDAVDRGFLTSHQASLRGDRVLYASTLALNHDMDMKTAFLITDNRMQFADAIEGAKEPGPFGRGGSTAKRARWAAVRIAGLIAVLSMALFALYASKGTPTLPGATAPALPSVAPPAASGSDQPSPVPGGSAFETDSEGRVTRVAADEKTEVLYNPEIN